MKKQLLTAIFVFFAAVACAPRIDPEILDTGITETAPNMDGMVSLSIGLASNLEEFLSVKYATVDINGFGQYGDFSYKSSLYDQWSPHEGTVKVAFYADQLKDFPKNMEGVPQQVTFNVWAEVKTPTSGRRVSWCGMGGVALDRSDTLYEQTVKALNKGLYGLPKGTADKYYLEFGITLDPVGGYAITPKWVKGCLFYDKEIFEKK